MIKKIKGNIEIKIEDGYIDVVDLDDGREVISDIAQEGVLPILNVINNIKSKSEKNYLEESGTMAKHFVHYYNYLCSLPPQLNNGITYAGENYNIWNSKNSSSWLYKWKGNYYLEIGYYESDEDGFLILESNKCIEIDDKELLQLEIVFEEIASYCRKSHFFF